MKNKPDNRRLSGEPRCGTCTHWQVIHRGERHLDRCAAFDCLCPKFSREAA